MRRHRPQALIMAVFVAMVGRIAVAAEFELGTQQFTLPAGFEIELVAGPPLVERPVAADFDERGRFYVVDSSGSNAPVQEQLKEKSHRIVRLEDVDGDGKFDNSVVFADKLMFPEGAMWHQGSLYVAAPPSIWKLTDTNDDGIADKREEWFAGKTLTGCANDLHGPYAGPDGWIYWCKGGFAEQTYERPGRTPLVTKAAHIFRCRPDGTGIESVMTGGMDNPVEIAFTPGGERIFSTTFLQHPGGGKRDGLIHAVYGGVYGKEWSPVDDHPQTGGILPVLCHLGAAAPCGLTRYESEVFGVDYRDNLFTCCFNMHKVTRHVLEPKGATFNSVDSNFLESSNVDFHPTDVLEDADGSLIVVDTGGWYKLCCPTSQLGKPDVLGAIYRVRRASSIPPVDPRGLQFNWSELKAEDLGVLLGDKRLVVRNRAVQELANGRADSLQVLGAIAAAGEPGPQTTELKRKASQSPIMRRNAIWALTRIDRPEARAAVRNALSDSDETVRQVAIHSISLCKDAQAAPQLTARLKEFSPQNCRVAAEALARIGGPASVAEILRTCTTPGLVADRMLEHSLIFAMIEIDDWQGTAKGLDADDPAIRRAALIALDQMPKGGLVPQSVAGLLGSPEKTIRETAAWIVSRHSQWGDALTEYLRSRLSVKQLSDAESAELEGQLVQFAQTPAVQDLLVQTVLDTDGSLQLRRMGLTAMSRSALKQPPAAWPAAVATVLSSPDEQLIGDAVVTARSISNGKEANVELSAALLILAQKSNLPTTVRLNALAAIRGGLSEVSPPLFQFLCDNLIAEDDVMARSLASDTLAKSKLTQNQLLELTDSFRSVGPLEVNRLLPAFKDSTDEELGLRLIAALRQSSVLTAFRVDLVKTNLAKFPARVQQQVDELCQLINVDAAMQKEKLDMLVATLKPGDIRRGQALFNSTRIACLACHSFGYLGGKVGPDLTKIGRIRQERDLLEAIIFPSASFVRSFEPVIVQTKSGKIYNGLITRDTSIELVLATGPKDEVHIARDEIEEMKPGTVSIMPAGLDRLLSPQELADLITFLKSAQ